MDTTKKGNSFEDKVFNRLRKMLSRNELGIHPSSCKIYQKKGYYSQLREKNIITDISIEVFAGQNIDPIMVWIIECKDYTSPIPVDDIEEFDRKVTQITGLNTKAIFVSSNSFQSGSVTFGRNRKIALIRLMPDENVEWWCSFLGSDTFREQQLNSQEFWNALTIENYKAINRDFYSLGNDKIFGDWATLFRYF